MRNKLTDVGSVSGVSEGMHHSLLCTRHSLRVSLLKGTVSWDGFFAHCILSRIERKDLKLISCCSSISWVRQDLTHLAHKENTQSDTFLWDRRKIQLNFVLWRLWYSSPSPVGEILTLWSPHKLLKNLGALSLSAKCCQSSTKIKKFEILTFYPGYDGIVKKQSHATVPLNLPPPLIWRNMRGFPQERKTVHIYCIILHRSKFQIDK